MNSDGAAKGNMGLAGTGAVVWDVGGVWIFAKVINLGIISSVIVEV